MEAHPQANLQDGFFMFGIKKVFFNICPII